MPWCAERAWPDPAATETWTETATAAARSASRAPGIRALYMIVDRRDEKYLTSDEECLENAYTGQNTLAPLGSDT